jgi:hypothetical protein
MTKMRHLSSGGVGAGLWSEVGDCEEAGVADMVGVADEEDGRTAEVVARSEVMRESVGVEYDL